MWSDRIASGDDLRSVFHAVVTSIYSIEAFFA